MGYKRDHDVSPYSDDKVKHKIIKDLDEAELDSQKIQDINIWPYFYFIIALFFSLFSFGSWTYPPFTWFFSIFFIRAFRSAKPLRAIIIGWLVLFISHSMVFENIIPASSLVLHIYTALISLPLLLPFIIDRLLSKQFKGIASTFIFPLATVSNYFLISQFDPYWNIISPAYSQLDFPAFSQILALTGMSGILLLLSWFASLVNYIWNLKFQWDDIRKTVIGFTLFIFSLNIAGYIRMNYSFADKSFRVSILNNTTETKANYLKNLGLLISGNIKTINFEKDIYPYFDKMNQRIIARSDREAKAGAKLILWAELNALVTDMTYNSFIEQVQNTAKKNQCYIAFGLGIFNTKETKGIYFKNKMILIDPSGSILWDYNKQLSLNPIDLNQPKNIPVIETELGWMAPAIGFDLFDPNRFLQWREQKPDFLLVSSSEWGDMDEFQLNVARARAIEHGITIIKSSDKGFSTVIDPNGNIIALMDFNKAKSERVMSLHVPNEKARSIYLLVGNAFNFLALVLLVGLAMFKISQLIKTSK